MKEDGVGLEAGAWLGRCPGCGPVFRGSTAKEFAMEQGCASQAMGAVSNNLLKILWSESVPDTQKD